MQLLPDTYLPTVRTTDWYLYQGRIEAFDQGLAERRSVQNALPERGAIPLGRRRFVNERVSFRPGIWKTFGFRATNRQGVPAPKDIVITMQHTDFSGQGYGPYA